MHAYMLYDITYIICKIVKIHACITYNRILYMHANMIINYVIRYYVLYNMLAYCNEYMHTCISKHASMYLHACYLFSCLHVTCMHTTCKHVNLFHWKFALRDDETRFLT